MAHPGPHQIPVDDSRMTVESQHAKAPELVGWSKDEKIDLHLAIKKYGFRYDLLQKRVPTKTEDQIKKLIDYFSTFNPDDKDKRSMPIPDDKDKRSMPIPDDKDKRSMPIPDDKDKRSMPGQKENRKIVSQIEALDEWAKLITDKNDYKDVQTDCAKAIRIIADNEKFPNPEEIDNIDFRKIYHYMADAMEGKPIPDDPIATAVFKYCLEETAALSKVIISEPELRTLCQELATGDGCVNFAHSTKDGGLQAIRTLMCTKNYNPLGMTENYLKYPQKYTDEDPIL